jgi:type IV secretory pathway TrbL component
MAITPTTDSGELSQRESTRFDVMRIAMALATLVAIVLIAALIFDSDAKGAAAFVGVAVPILTAAIGVSVGVHAGERSGNAKAAQAVHSDRAKVKQAIKPVCESLGRRANALTSTVERASTTAANRTERVIKFAPAEGREDIRFEGDVIDGLRTDVAHLQGIVNRLHVE